MLQAVSLFLQIKGGECTRARGAKPRDARNEGGTRMVNYVSRALCSTVQEKRETARSLGKGGLMSGILSFSR